MAARLAVLLSVALLAVAAGCGGDDEDSTTEWADGLCSAIGTWQAELQSVGESIQSDPTRDGIEGAVDDLREATESLRDDLEDLGRPETEAGDEAEAAVSTLVDNLLTATQTIDRALEGAEGTGAVSALTTITTTFATMGQQVSAAFGQLEQADAGGELESAFEEADACTELRSGS